MTFLGRGALWGTLLVGSGSLAVLTTAPSLTGCSDCLACLPSPSLVLTTTGYVVVSATSSCISRNSGVTQFSSGSQVYVDTPASAVTCQVAVTLDDGEQIAFDVPFTTPGPTECCERFYKEDDAPLVINAPPGYVPLTDAGVDASPDATDAPPDAWPDALDDVSQDAAGD